MMEVILLQPEHGGDCINRSEDNTIDPMSSNVVLYQYSYLFRNIEKTVNDKDLQTLKMKESTAR